MAQLQPRRVRPHEPDQPVEAQRGGGQGGGDGAGAGAGAGADGQPVRPAGRAHHQARQVAHVLLHEAPEHRRPGGGHLPGAAPAHLGHHFPFLRTRHPVPAGEVPAGGGHVRVHLHAGADVHRQVPGHLPAPALPAPEEGPVLRDPVLVAEPPLQHPADVHLLPEGGRQRRVRGLRLLGGLRAAVGGQGVHHVDQPSPFTSSP